jgi:hypothetical protein
MISSRSRARVLARVVFTALLAIPVLDMPATTVHADHGACPSATCPVSEGIYRIPYVNGTSVTVGGDAHTHDPENRIDMSAGVGTQVVAAASGVIRAIVDFNGNFPGAGDGVDINGNPQDDALEHSCQDGKPAVENSVVVGFCQQYNNYVWIEHPNGEWTKYSHMGTGTTTALGWVVGAWVNAGDVIGVEGDVGRASGPHLHHEVAVPFDPDDLTPFSVLGGFIDNFGINVVPIVCDIGGNNQYVEPESYTANPCVHVPPTAAAGGPYSVDEGSTVQLDGTGSNDPEGNPLTYLWDPSTNLDDPASAEPTFTAIDDSVNPITLNVYDQIEQLPSSDSTTITVVNVPPTVTPTGAVINEAGTAMVSATFTDPGTLDTHTAAIAWGDGSPVQAVTVVQLAAGVAHVYGDNGVYNVTITVIDDDGGAGVGMTAVTVNNLDPSVSVDAGNAVSFPGGDYVVAEAGDDLALSAQATDPGSDDLTFTWSTGDVNTYFNHGIGPDPAQSPGGTFPFAAQDDVVASLDDPGVETPSVEVTDDDGGSDDASANVIVVGNAESTEGSGWWKHQYSGNGSPHIDAATAAGYLEVVNAVSSVFSEAVVVATAADVHAVLSPDGGDRFARARAALMIAWLQFASGAVGHDALVPLGGHQTIAFLDLMFVAEDVILNPASTNTQLSDVEQLLDKVKQAS